MRRYGTPDGTPAPTTAEGRPIPGVLIVHAREIISRVPALRRDVATSVGPFTVGETSPRGDTLLDSLCQADLQRCPVTLANVDGDPTMAPGWADAVAFEQRAAADDAHCRQAVVKTVREAAAPQLVEFARQHAADLDRVTAGWAWIEVDARNAETAAGPKD